MSTSDDNDIEAGYSNFRGFSHVLLEELSSGYEVHSFGNYIPAYIFDLVAQLSKNKSDNPGFLDLWFQIPFKFNGRPDGIALLVEFIRKSASDLDEAVQFIEDCLYLIETKALGVGLTYHRADAPKSAICRGVILDRSNQDDLWTYTDNRSTKSKNEIITARNWLDDEYIEAQKGLEMLVSLSAGRDPRLDTFHGGEAIGWLGYASDWGAESGYEEELATKGENFLEAEPGEDVTTDPFELVMSGLIIDEVAPTNIFERTYFDIYESVLDYLTGLDEFRREGDYEYTDEVEREIRDYIEDARKKFGEIDCTEDRERYQAQGDHHLPPISDPLRFYSIGEATCECICGEPIIRRNGCHEISW